MDSFRKKFQLQNQNRYINEQQSIKFKQAAVARKLLEHKTSQYIT